MTIQQLKDRINGWFRQKSPVERQKMMKYAVVMPAAIISGIVIIWLIFGSSQSSNLLGNAFNTELPEGEKSKVGTKAEEYAIADLAKEKESNQAVVATLDTLTSESADTVPQSSAITESATQYQEVCQSLNDFYIPEDNSAAQVAELQARIDELEVENAMVQQSQHPNEMELMEQSYKLAAQYLGTGNGGQQAVIVDEPDEDRKVMPVNQVNRNVVSSLSASTDNTRSFSTAVGTKRTNFKNTISACVATDQSITDGQSVRLQNLRFQKIS